MISPWHVGVIEGEIHTKEMAQSTVTITNKMKGESHD